MKRKEHEGLFYSLFIRSQFSHKISDSTNMKHFLKRFSEEKRLQNFCHSLILIVWYLLSNDVLKGGTSDREYSVSHFFLVLNLPNWVEKTKSQHIDSVTSLSCFYSINGSSFLGGWRRINILYKGLGRNESFSLKRRLKYECMW